MRRLVVILLILATGAQAGDTLLTREYDLYEDAFIRDPGIGYDSCYGDADSLECGNRSSAIVRMIMGPDNTLGGVLGDLNDTLDLIDSMVYCSLRFTLDYQTSIQDADSCQVNPLLAAFEEDTVSWARRTAAANWNTAGCAGAGTDYDDGFVYFQPISDTLSGGVFGFEITDYFDSLVSGDVAYFYGFRVIHYGERRNRFSQYYSSDVSPPGSYEYLYPRIRLKFWMQTSEEESGAITNRHGNPDRHGAIRP